MTDAAKLAEVRNRSFLRLGLKLQEQQKQQQVSPIGDARRRSFEKLGVPVDVTGESITSFVNRFPGFTEGKTRAEVAVMVEGERLRAGGTIGPLEETVGQAARRNVVGFVRGFERAATDVPIEQSFNALAAMADLFDRPELADASRAEANRIASEARLRSPETFDRGVASGAGEFFGMIAPSAAFLATGGVAGPALLTYFGLQAFGGGSREYREIMLARGIEPNAVDQFAVGVGYGLAEVVAEKIGLNLIGGRITKDVMQRLGDAALEGSTKKAAIILNGLAISGSVNSVEEMLTQVAQNASISNVAFFGPAADPDRPVTQGVGEAGLLGLAGGGVLGGASFTGSFLREGIPAAFEPSLTQDEMEISLEALEATGFIVPGGKTRVDTIFRKDPRNITPGDGDGFVFTQFGEVGDVSAEALLEAAMDEKRSEEDRTIAAAILEDMEPASEIIEEVVTDQADQAANEGDVAAVEAAADALGPQQATRAQVTAQQKADFLERLGFEPGKRGKVPVARRDATAAIAAQQKETRAQQREAIVIERRKAREETKRRTDAVEARMKAGKLDAAGARTAIRQIVNQNVEPGLRGRFNKVISDAKTMKDVAKVIPRIRKAVSEARRKKARGRFAKAANRLRRRRGLTTEVGEVVKGVFGKRKFDAQAVKDSITKLSTDSLEARADQLEQAVRDQRTAEGTAKRTRKEMIERISLKVSLEIMATEQPRRFVKETSEEEPRTTLNQIIPSLGIADMTTLSTLTDILGGNEGSSTQEFLYKQLNDGRRNQNRVMWELVDQFNAMLQDISEAELVAMSDTLSEVPGLLARGGAMIQADPIRASVATVVPMPISESETVRVTPAVKMGLLATIRDPATRKQITDGRPVTFETWTRTITLTEEDLARIEADATKTERLIVDAVIGLINGPMKERFAEVSEKTTGQNLTSEQTHYPRHARITDEVARNQANAMTFDTTAMSRQADIQNADLTKEREAHTTTTIEVRDIFGEFNNQVWVMTNVTELGPAASAASSILNSVAVQGVLASTKRGKAISRRINEQYNRMARDVVGGAPVTVGESLLRNVIRGVQVGALGWNIPVMAYQHASMFNAAAVPGMNMGALMAAEAEGAFFKATQTDAEIKEFSPSLRTRSVGGSFGIVHEGPTGRAVLGREQAGILDIPMIGIRAVDAATIRVIWRAAQIQLGESGPTEQTAALAEEIVNQSQPTTDSLYTTGLGIQTRNSVGVAMLTMFRGQTAKTLDQVVRATVLHKRGRISATERNRVYLIALVAPAVMLTVIGTPGISGLILKGFPDDGDELEDLLLDAGFGFLRRLTGIIPVIGGDIVSLAELAIRGSTFTGTAAPATAIVSNIVAAFSSVRAAASRGDALDIAKAISRVLEATPPIPAFPLRAFRQGVLDRLDDDEPSGKSSSRSKR